MSSSKYASFAPYVSRRSVLNVNFELRYPNLKTPPPDEGLQASTSTTKSPSRPWFPTHASSQGIDTSYQSGGIPTFNSSASGGLGAAEEAEAQQNQWETRYGMRVDVLAAVTYLLSPVTGMWSPLSSEALTMILCR